MKYLKPFYHIDEVVELWKKIDSTITVEDVYNLAVTNGLKTGLLVSKPIFGIAFIDDSKASKLYDLKNYDSCCLEDIKKVHRILYDSLKKPLDSCNCFKQKDLFSKKIITFLKEYRYFRKKNIIKCKNYVLIKNKKTREVKAISGKDDIFIFNNYPFIIYPNNYDFFKKLCTLNVFNIKNDPKGNERFTTEKGENITVIGMSYDKDYSILVDCLRTDLYRILLQKNEIYISKHELMKYEQKNGIFDHKLNLTKPNNKPKKPPVNEQRIAFFKDYIANNEINFN